MRISVSNFATTDADVDASVAAILAAARATCSRRRPADVRRVRQAPRLEVLVVVSRLDQRSGRRGFRWPAVVNTFGNQIARFATASCWGSDLVARYCGELRRRRKLASRSLAGAIVIDPGPCGACSTRRCGHVRGTGGSNRAPDQVPRVRLRTW